MTKKGKYSPTLHRNGTVTFWSVSGQNWVRVSRVHTIPNSEWLAMPEAERRRIWHHLFRFGVP